MMPHEHVAWWVLQTDTDTADTDTADADGGSHIGESASGSSLLPDELTPISYTLIALTLAFGVLCSTLLYLRRQAFPMNGRAIILVTPIMIVGVFSTVFRFARTIVDPLPCWARHVDYYIGLCYTNLILVRVFRLWFKVKLSNEILLSHRAERRRREEFLQNAPPRTKRRSSKFPRPQAAASAFTRKSSSPISTHSQPKSVDDDSSISSTSGVASAVVDVADDVVKDATETLESSATSGPNATIDVMDTTNTSLNMSSDTNTSVRSSSATTNTVRAIRHVSSLPEGRDITPLSATVNKRTLVSVREINIEVLENDPSVEEMYMAPMRSSSAKRGAFSRWQRLGASSTLWRFSLIWNVCEVAMFFGIFQGKYGCARLNDDVALLVIGLRSACGYLAFLCLAWKMRNSRDGFFLRQETIYGVWSYTILLLLLVVRSLLAAKHWALSYVVAVSTIHPTMCFCVFPIAKSYRWDFHPFYPWTWFGWIPVVARGVQPTKSEMEWNDLPLIDLLTREEHKDSREEFENHLASEFAIENIVFFFRAKEFHEQGDTLSDDQLALKAVDIFFNYIAVGSPNQVNIVAKARQEIERELGEKFPNFADFNPHKHKRRPSISQTFSSATATGATAIDSRRRHSLAPTFTEKLSPRSQRERAGSTSKSAARRSSVHVEMVVAARAAAKQRPPAPTHSRSANHLDSLPSSSLSPRSKAAAGATATGGRVRGRTLSRSDSLEIDLNDRLSHDLFESARQQVYALMSRDPYSRFKAARRHSSSL